MSAQPEASACPTARQATLETAILAICAQNVTLHALLVAIMTSSFALTAILPSHAMCKEREFALSTACVAFTTSYSRLSASSASAIHAMLLVQTAGALLISAPPVTPKATNHSCMTEPVLVSANQASLTREVCASSATHRVQDAQAQLTTAHSAMVLKVAGTFIWVNVSQAALLALVSKMRMQLKKCASSALIKTCAEGAIPLIFTSAMNASSLSI